uniref:Uncharacterized protein n=1 Tax=Ciona intestinalis TaxID=7719 RepID=H2XM93_CIOIN
MRKKERYWIETSTSQLPPNSLCSSTVSRPPENAYLLIFFLIWLAVSVRNIDDVGSEELILV